MLNSNEDMAQQSHRILQTFVKRGVFLSLPVHVNTQRRILFFLNLAAKKQKGGRSLRRKLDQE